MSKWITGLLSAIALAGVCHADTAPQYFKAYQTTIHLGDPNNYPADFVTAQWIVDSLVDPDTLIPLIPNSAVLRAADYSSAKALAKLDRTYGVKYTCTVSTDLLATFEYGNAVLLPAYKVGKCKLVP